MAWHGMAEVQLFDRGEDPRSSVQQIAALLEDIVRQEPETPGASFAEGASERASEKASDRAAEAFHLLGRARFAEASYRYRIGENPQADFEAAVQNLERAIDLGPLSAGPRARLSEVLTWLAEWRMPRGMDPSEDLDRAVTTAQEAADLQPGMFHAFYSLGRALMIRAMHRTGQGVPADADLMDAETAFLKGEVLDPNSLATPGALCAVRIERAKLLRKRGEDSEAVLLQAVEAVDRWLDRSEDAFPRLQRAQCALGLAWNRLERGDDPTEHTAAARRFFLEGLESVPGIAGAWIELAEAHLIEARWALAAGLPVTEAAAEAERHAHHVLKIDASRSDGHRIIALAELVRASGSSGRPAAEAIATARAAIEQAIEMAPDTAAHHVAFARLAWMVAASRQDGDSSAKQQKLVHLGLNHAAEAERIDAADAEATLLRGALLALDEETQGEGEALMAAARKRNPRVILDWRPGSPQQTRVRQR